MASGEPAGHGRALAENSGGQRHATNITERPAWLQGKKGEEEEKLEPLEKTEVIRRLRALGQPATLFAEVSAHRVFPRDE